MNQTAAFITFGLGFAAGFVMTKPNSITTAYFLFFLSNFSCGLLFYSAAKCRAVPYGSQSGISLAAAAAFVGFISWALGSVVSLCWYLGVFIHKEKVAHAHEPVYALRTALDSMLGEAGSVLWIFALVTSAVSSLIWLGYLHQLGTSLKSKDVPNRVTLILVVGFLIVIGCIVFFGLIVDQTKTTLGVGDWAFLLGLLASLLFLVLREAWGKRPI